MQEMRQLGIFCVTDCDDNTRIDRYVKQIIPGITQSLIEKLLRRKAILLDQKRVKSNCRVYNGQVVYIKDNIINNNVVNEFNQKKKENHCDKLIQLIKTNILYEDDNILAINKPAGVSVQGGSKVRICIDDVLNKIRPGENFKIVHRLDKDTSGVLLLARNRKSACLIAEEFQNCRVKKKYLALTNGIPKHEVSEINCPIEKLYVSGQEKMVARQSACKRASTQFFVRDKFFKTKTAFLEIDPLTGRKHQIRVHLSYINCPIVGDKKYGISYSDNRVVSENLQLHAYSLSIQILNRNSVTIIAPIPNHMEKFINFLKNQEI